ncbi:MAG TPA: transposase [Alphaproteobacteria bacterium]|nr:transposase [Alphaproteobacteria bacterium]
MRMRDALGAIYADAMLAALYPQRGQPAAAPWRLALVSVMQFAAGLADRQAAEAVRSRIDWKYALGLELTDPGFDFSVLSEFRARLITGGLEQLLLDRMLECFVARGLVKTRGRQRTDSTHVLAAIRALSRLETVTETPRAALGSLAHATPAWLAGGSGPTGSTAMDGGSRTAACRGAQASTAPWSTPSAPMAMRCWPPSTPRRRRPGCGSCRHCKPCGPSGSSSSISPTRR